MVVTVLSLISVFLYRRSLGDQKRYQTVTGKGYRVGVIDVGAWRHLFSALGLGYGILTSALPYLTLVSVSFLKSLGHGVRLDNLTLAHYTNVFGSALAREAVVNSTILALSAATLCTLLGAVVAYLIVRTALRWGTLLDYVAALPMGIAGTAFAVGVLGAYMVPPLRSLGLYGTLWILLVTYVAKYMPLAVRNTQAGLAQISNDLEESARIAGGDWLRTTRLITIPLVRSALLNGWVLVFLSSFSELSASIILRNIGTATVATAILDLWDGAGGYQDAAALGSLVFLLVTAVFLLPNRLFGRSLLKTT
jgi:iron(III) transport system permease protein